MPNLPLKIRKHTPLLAALLCASLFIFGLDLFTTCTAVDIPFDPEDAGTTVIETNPDSDGEKILNDQSGGGGIAIFRTAFINAYSFIKYFVIGLGVALFTYAGIHLVGTAGTKKTDEVIEKEKTNIKWAFLGLGAFLLLDVFVTTFFGLGEEAGTLFNDITDTDKAFSAAENFTIEILALVDFIFSIAAVIAVLSIIVASLRMLAASGNEEAVNKHRRVAGMVVLGLALMALAKSIVGRVIFGFIGSGVSRDQLGTYVNAENAAMEILGITNYILGFIGTIALVMVVYSALRMAAARGNDDEVSKAKEILIASLTGLVIAFASYTIVATFINPS
jgi:hypothetical protein